MLDWEVKISKKLSKEITIFPNPIRIRLAVLIEDIKNNGPIQPNWPNFSKLSTYNYHCHLKKGRPTYVVCWSLIDKKIN